MVWSSRWPEAMSWPRNSEIVRTQYSAHNEPPLYNAVSAVASIQCTSNAASIAGSRRPMK